MSASISQRAIGNGGGVSDVPRDPTDRDRLREEWRLLALASAKARNHADRLTEGRKILLALMTRRLTDTGMAANKAEIEARSSTQFQEHVELMHVARLAADEAWIAAENADRLYWSNVSQEADSRTERRMSR